jgi:hypothetical protein
MSDPSDPAASQASPNPTAEAIELRLAAAVEAAYVRELSAA